jgi:hypothetical protein
LKVTGTVVAVVAHDVVVAVDVVVLVLLVEVVEVVELDPDPEPAMEISAQPR